MESNFEWDEEKAKANFRQHKVSFDEGTTVFSDPYSITVPDPTIPQTRNAILTSVVPIKGGC